MKRLIRVNPGFVLIASSAIALVLAACVKEGDDAPPLPGVLGGLMMTAAGGSAGSMGNAGSGGSAGQGGGAGQGGSAGGGAAGNAGSSGVGGAAGNGTLPDAGADGG
jgi:hypothetical protein